MIRQEDFSANFRITSNCAGNDPVRQVCVSGAQICVKLISDFISGICFFYQFPVYPQFLHNFIDQISVIEFNSQRVGRSSGRYPVPRFRIHSPVLLQNGSSVILLPIYDGPSISSLLCLYGFLQNSKGLVTVLFCQDQRRNHTDNAASDGGYKKFPVKASVFDIHCINCIVKFYAYQKALSSDFFYMRKFFSSSMK